MNELILVHYVDCSVHGIEILSKYSDVIKDNSCINYIIPIYNGETRIECINPKLLKDNEYQTILDKLEELKIKNMEFLKAQYDKHK
jgi:hypothetical protein